MPTTSPLVFALIGLAASAKRIIAWIKGRQKTRLDEPATPPPAA